MVALGVGVIGMGVAGTLRGPGVDGVSLCIGGSTVLNGAAITRPQGRLQRALVAGALVLAVAGLVAAFL